MEETFPYLHAEPDTLPVFLDPFTVTTSTGFLPFQHPQVELPKALAPLAHLCETFPIVKADEEPGLLATYELGSTIDEGALPDLSAEIDKLVLEDGKPDLAAVTAVFRDYAFLASAYLLEPCWKSWNEDHDAGYGTGRQVLPKEIAGPLVKTAALLDIPPFMSYAAAYSLYNYRLASPSLGLGTYSNLRLIRAFERGLKPSSSEAGFVLTHVDMVRHSPALISGAFALLSSIPTSRSSANTALRTLLGAMSLIESAMEAMWTHSLPRDYLSYRTFIFGITSQSMFPRGVVYEGQFGDRAVSFRGESGANDSMIPLLDALCEIAMPKNPLTDILADFRSYRPKPHRVLLGWVASRAAELGVRRYCEADRETAELYLRLLDTVRSFRWRHWLFAREYILKRTKYGVATGGSPMATWLPNQLQAVMGKMEEVWEGLKGEEVGTGTREMMENVGEQREKLDREVGRWCQERGI